MYWFEIRTVRRYSYEGHACVSPQCHYVLATSSDVALKHHKRFGEVVSIRTLAGLPKLSMQQIRQRKIDDLHRQLMLTDPSHKPPGIDKVKEESKASAEAAEVLPAWHVSYSNYQFGSSKIVVLADTPEAAVQCAKETGVEPFASAYDGTCVVEPCDVAKVTCITPAVLAREEEEARQRHVQYQYSELEKLKKEQERMQRAVKEHQKKIDAVAATIKGLERELALP